MTDACASSVLAGCSSLTLGDFQGSLLMRRLLACNTRLSCGMSTASWQSQHMPEHPAVSCLAALVVDFCAPARAQILGNNECFEPYTSNIYVRRVLSGEFTVVNQHLLMDLTALGLWNADMKNELVAANGSVQARACAPTMLPYSVSHRMFRQDLTDELKSLLLCMMTGSAAHST